jgi:Uma2 family endonuclease
MNALLRPIDVLPQVVPMTVTACRLLDENGFFDGDTRRYELIDGVLMMAPMPSSGHYFVELRANQALMRAILGSIFADTHSVQTGGSLRMDELTLLGPDLMIIPVPLEPKETTADDIVTLIEIAWSSRANDLGPKARLYATAGIADYWVLDVPAKAVIVHRDPEDGIYTSVQTLTAPATVSCLKLPDIAVAVADLF